MRAFLYGIVRASRTVPRRLGRIIRYTSLLLLCFFLFLGAWGVVYRYQALRVCGVFPNGLLIGREALFNRRGEGGEIYARLKLPDGEFLLDMPAYDIRFSETTVWGRAWPKQQPPSAQNQAGKHRLRPYRFAYRPDAGLVRETQSPELYARLRRDSGPSIFPPRVAPRRMISEITLFHALAVWPQTRREDCPLNIFPPPP